MAGRAQSGGGCLGSNSGISLADCKTWCESLTFSCSQMPSMSNGARKVSVVVQ